MSKLFERLLEKRGLGSDFLHPKYEDLTDPYLLPDLEKAVERITQATQTGEKILIYGDYDVDGVTASTVMADTLTLAGIKPENIDIMLPDRFTDGYGMSSRLIARAKKQGASLVITVDCGSRNHAIIDELNTLNIDTIVTDHHECGDTLPEAVAVVNPKRPDFTAINGLRDLAGVGVAFKVAQGLVKKGIISDGQEKWLLDLVLIGTICDNMLFTGENRILGYYGVKVLAKTRRAGLKELMSKARVKSLTAESIGFQIGPRLNAAGRLQSADLSLSLLRSTSPTEAATLAEQLEELNKKRKAEQQTAMKEISAHGVSDDPVIIETGTWHEGVLGIIAGRLLEDYHRPAFALSEVENGIFKGSGRSFGDFNLAKALNFAKDSIIGGGGHAGAAGVRVDGKKLYEFRERINEYYKSLHLTNQEEHLRQRADLDVLNLADLSLQFLDELKLLEPFGPGNEEPIFRLPEVDIVNISRMGAERNHLRLDIRDKKGNSLKLVAFYASEQWIALTPEDKVVPLVKLMKNDFNGVKSVEARIVDIELIS
ncbi:single-stranded-DNA-specific exonuclease RecJ [Candidatus Nanosyncoccus alces]|uniref:Single-stranded-DNA-specific exonuclease RecJ n=1 Tax=Candidatus Nanosyncoccus alces TaxID=2171997 RepID=A0ABY0FLE6_9BACT|nr:single-stranded-DNA-specific exonuclease RecJ [Candidatus Nanosyncoccus alces]RYC74576.1 Single-stranded-DNA-specific exonuclease RecJ [Candidatus Nanosyncoccus alces]